LQSNFMSGCADRQAKIEAAIRTLLTKGWSKDQILHNFYNIGIDRRDTERALAIIESGWLEADLQRAEKNAVEAAI